MSYDLPVRRSQQIGSAFTVATLPSLSQMVGEPIGMLAYTVDNGLYAWTGSVWVSVAATAAVAVGVSPITGGSSGNILYDNAGVVGELANTGTGNNVLQTSPALITPSIDVATGVSLALSSANGLTLGGSVLAKTNTLLYTLPSYYISSISAATTIAITGASWTTNVATLTFSAITRAIPIGTVITVTGMTPSGYNVANVQVTASSTTSVSYALLTNPGAFSSGGTLANGTTYTPSAGAIQTTVMGAGGGGGGGGGALTASGTAASGGASGGAGAVWLKAFKTTDLGASVSIVVGAGGTAGVASTTNSTAGSAGGNGGVSQFGNFIWAQSGAGGAGGQIGANSGGGGGGGLLGSATAGSGSTAGAGGTNGGNGSNSGVGSTGISFLSFGGGCGGSAGINGAAGSGGQSAGTGGSSGAGAGGGVSTTPAAFSGANSGFSPYFPIGSQASGGAANTNGGSLAKIDFFAPGSGGGGGGSGISGTAGNGGPGNFCGGGGGGGSNLNTFTAGAGGKGGDGFVIIVEYF